MFQEHVTAATMLHHYTVPFQQHTTDCNIQRRDSVLCKCLYGRHTIYSAFSWLLINIYLFNVLSLTFLLQSMEVAKLVANYSKMQPTPTMLMRSISSIVSIQHKQPKIYIHLFIPKAYLQPLARMGQQNNK